MRYVAEFLFQKFLAKNFHVELSLYNIFLDKQFSEFLCLRRSGFVRKMYDKQVRKKLNLDHHFFKKVLILSLKTQQRHGAKFVNGSSLILWRNAFTMTKQISLHSGASLNALF